jgi:hypothetical protein
MKNFMGTGIKKSRASDSDRTATTARPCFVSDLGDSAGAGRMRLAPCKGSKSTAHLINPKYALENLLRIEMAAN